jgi:hypothetical protein
MAAVVLRRVKTVGIVLIRYLFQVAFLFIMGEYEGEGLLAWRRSHDLQPCPTRMQPCKNFPPVTTCRVTISVHIQTHLTTSPTTNVSIVFISNLTKR